MNAEFSSSRQVSSSEREQEDQQLYFSFYEQQKPVEPVIRPLIFTPSLRSNNDWHGIFQKEYASTPASH